MGAGHYHCVEVYWVFFLFFNDLCVCTSPGMPERFAGARRTKKIAFKKEINLGRVGPCTVRASMGEEG